MAYDDLSLKTTTRLDPDSQLPRRIMRIQSIVYMFVCLALSSVITHFQFRFMWSAAKLPPTPPRNFHFLRHLSQPFNVTNQCTSQQKGESAEESKSIHSITAGHVRWQIIQGSVSKAIVSDPRPVRLVSDNETC